MHEGKEVHVNGWKHGYEIAINHLVAVMKELDVTPNRTIFVVEGQYSKTRREMIYADYKKGGTPARQPHTNSSTYARATCWTPSVTWVLKS